MDARKFVVGEEGSSGSQVENVRKVTEVYTRQIPRMACLRRWFARDIVEMDFAEDFEVREYTSNVEIGKRRRKMCCYFGNFVFAPDIDVNVYEGDRFARVYLRYDSSTESVCVKEVRNILEGAGLVRRLGLGKIKKP